MNILEQLEQFLLDAKKQTSRGAPNQVTNPTTQKTEQSVVFEVCDLYNDTVISHRKQIEDKLRTFMDFKKQNPMTPANKRDSSLAGTGPFASAIPGMRKAHLNMDVSVWYTVTGSNPKIIKLYAVLTHEESGTGDTPKINKQATIADRMKKQSFKQM